MRDDEDTTAELTKIFFQPFTHDNIQVVRRFVEDEQIRRIDKSRRQLKARFLSARKGQGVVLPGGFWIAQSHQDPLDVIFVVITIQVCIAGFHPTITVQDIL